MFCTRCGTKLDLSSLTRSSSGRAFDLPRFLRGAVRVTIFLALLVLLLLLIWPTTLAGQRGKDEDVAALLGQRQALTRAVQDKQEVKLELSEAALNAYLAATLKVAHSNEEAVAAWMMRLAELHVALQPGVLTVTTLAHWGPLAITWELSGIPKVADGHFALEVKSGCIGHLGLPQAGAEAMAARVAALFNRWGTDRALLDQLASVAVDKGTVTLVTKAAKP
jgi:hypothetical protein